MFETKTTVENKTNSETTKIDQIHNKALLAAKTYNRSEIDLIEILEEVDRHRVYYHQGFNSLFKYATDALVLSEEVAYIFINVCRKVREVPKLKEEIKNGAITISKAKRITSVLTPQNQNYWLDLAKSASKKTIEKTVASVSPKSAVREQFTYVHPELEIKEHIKIINLAEAPQDATQGLTVMPKEKTRVQLQAGVSEKLMLKLRRAQDILSQKRGTSVDLEATLAAAIDLFIEKNDPLKKAERHVMRGHVAKGAKIDAKIDTKKDTGTTTNLLVRPSLKSQGQGTALKVPASNLKVPTSKRQPIPQSTRHKLWLKFQGQCSYLGDNHQHCYERRFLHIHHEKPVAKGGTNDLTNLSLLCAGHHRAEHLPK